MLHRVSALFLLVALAGCDDPPPLPLPPLSDTIAWGEVENGLQVGIACNGQVVVGQSVTCSIYFHNVTDHSIEIEYQRDFAAGPPIICDADGARFNLIGSLSVHTFGPLPRRTIRPGERVGLQLLTVETRPLVFAGDPTMLGELNIAPGPYRVSHQAQFYRGNIHCALKTGEFALIVLPRPEQRGHAEP
jgi:hypothetical protein